MGEDAAKSMSTLAAARFATEVDAFARFDAVADALADLPGRATIEAMLAHRSCRSFTDAPLADDLLDLVLAAAFSTPSKSDLQQCSVVVVDDPVRRRAIGDLIPTMPWIVESARFLVFCADSRRIRQVATRADVPFANDHLDAVLNAAGDAAMHLASFVWAAEAVGLATCPISVVRNHIEEVSDIIGLPAQVFPFAGMCVGWPQRLLPLSPRLPATVTVHHDRYDDGDAADRIADYDVGRAAVGRPVPPERQLDVDRWGVADHYGWSVEKARMVARRERDQLARFLVDRGFRLD